MSTMDSNYSSLSGMFETLDPNDKYFILLEDKRCNWTVADFSNDSVDFINDFYGVFYSLWDMFIITIVLPILLIIGLLDNIAFIYVVYHVQRMKTPTNICLINLAVADMLYLVSSLTKRLWLISQSANQYDISPIGQTGSILYNFFTHTAFFASVGFITLVSVERYMKVCKPLKTRGRSRSRQKMFNVVLPMIWILAIGYSSTFIPDHLHCRTFCVIWPESLTRFNSFWLMCQPIPDQRYIIYRNFAECLPFFISFTFSIILYAVIIHELNKTVKRSSTKSKKIKMRNQVAWMLIVNGTLYFLLVSPFEIVSFIDGITAIKGGDPPDGPTKLLSKISLPLSYLNSVINPFIYIAMSSRYRNAFKAAFSCSIWSFKTAGRYRKQATMEETVNSVSTAVTSDTTRESTPLNPVPSQTDLALNQPIAELQPDYDSTLPVNLNYKPI